MAPKLMPVALPVQGVRWAGDDCVVLQDDHVVALDRISATVLPLCDGVTARSAVESELGPDAVDLALARLADAGLVRADSALLGRRAALLAGMGGAFALAAVALPAAAAAASHPVGGSSVATPSLPAAPGSTTTPGSAGTPGSTGAPGSAPVAVLGKRESRPAIGGNPVDAETVTKPTSSSRSKAIAVQPSSALAYTGADTADMAKVAVGLVTAGAGAVVAAQMLAKRQAQAAE